MTWLETLLCSLNHLLLRLFELNISLRYCISLSLSTVLMLVCNFKVLFIGHFLYNQFLSVAAAAYCVWNVHGHLIPLLKQELLEVADEGLHCLAWQSYKTPSYEREDCSVHSIQAVDFKRTARTIGSFKS